MSSKSIKNSIVLSSLLGVGMILTITAVTANWFIVGWLEDNFDDNLLTKAQLLVTLFEEDEDGLEFNFADEFMPEFERNENPEYFQFWYLNGDVFERSNSLNGQDLPLESKKLELPNFQDIILFEGSKGRLLKLNFVPQLDKELRSVDRKTSDVEMILVLAREREWLDFLMLVVNLSAFLPIPPVLLLIYFAIRIATERGLRPLDELKIQLEGLDVNHLAQPVVINTPVLDMESVVKVINQALERISESFKREQRFTSDAAHELRTPIAELMNMAEVASKWPKKVNHSDFYLDVLKSSEKMHLIVNSLLELARCKNGQIIIEDSEFNVSERFFDNWKMFSRQAEEKNIEFKFSGDPNLVIISSFTEFDRVVSNLLSNAVEYGRENSTIVANALQDGTLVSVAISNTTDKLDEEDLPYLFENLWRKDDSRNSEHHIGMGLSIVKAYAEILDFDIETSLSSGLYSVVVSGLKSVKGH